MKTITFYSYTGGTGRSLLLANTARNLASLGYRVVAADFDFEAPGLHYKLIGTARRNAEDIVPERGVVDYLLATTQGSQPPKSLRPYGWPARLPSDTNGSLYLMPAGAAPAGEYWKALTSLLRQDLFTDPEGSGISACLEWKARVEAEFEADFLLIDSSSGVTELAGITTAVLADKVVCLMLPKRVGQVGARAVLRSLRRASRLADQAPIEVIPVLSRVPADLTRAAAVGALLFLNEQSSAPEDTLAFERVFVLRDDPHFATNERALPGSMLLEDSWAFLRCLTEVDPAEPQALQHGA